MPSRNSEFAHPEVLIGLSVLAYRYEGLRLENLLELVKDLKKQLLKQPGPFAERPARILFQDWVDAAKILRAKQQQAAKDDGKGDDEELDVLPLELFQPEDKSQMEVLWNVLNKASLSISSFCGFVLYV